MHKSDLAHQIYCLPAENPESLSLNNRGILEDGTSSWRFLSVEQLAQEDRPALEHQGRDRNRDKPTRGKCSNVLDETVHNVAWKNNIKNEVRKFAPPLL